MGKITSTPFNEYREEQSGIKLTDYFVRPDYFNQLGDNKPKMIYGSRGTGKTTLLKALTIEQAEDPQCYLNENEYIGFYYRTDLNIASVFGGLEMEEAFWHKLYSYYFVCSISYVVLKQINEIRDLICADEKTICREISDYFNKDNITSFTQLISEIKKEERQIEKYLNNIPYRKPPEIGAYVSLLRDIPKIVFDNSNCSSIKNKHFVYLIDEFESLQEYQQKAILSLVKYADQRHTYIIGLRPLGLKISTTVGNEYIRETDDYRTLVLDEVNSNFNEFALKVCNKRIELFYKNHYQNIEMIPEIKAFLNPEKKVDEVEVLFGTKSVQDEHDKRVRTFLDSFGVDNEEIYRSLVDEPKTFYLIVLKLIKDAKKIDTIDQSIIKKEIMSFKNKDKQHTEFANNYRIALIYYLYRLYGRNKFYYGFNTIVELSGNTLRYLLEMCNEIFLRANREYDDFYENPHFIEINMQSEEIGDVSRRRLEQIKAVPDIGPKIRQFINAFGEIASLHHIDSRLTKWELNHFSIKSSNIKDKEITEFLNECVFRGILVQFENNKIKVKNTISFDQYIYKMHSIYAPKFQISYRKKQKIEFEPDEIAIMIGNDTNSINKLINKYAKRVLSNNIEAIIQYLKNGGKIESIDGQMSFFDDDFHEEW